MPPPLGSFRDAQRSALSVLSFVVLVSVSRGGGVERERQKRVVGVPSCGPQLWPRAPAGITEHVCSPPTADAAAAELPRTSYSCGQLSVAVDDASPSRAGQGLPRATEADTAGLSPSLVPAPQPTISLLSSAHTDTLSLEAPTLVPPVDTDSILAVGCAQPPAPEADTGLAAEEGSAAPTPDCREP